MNVHIAVYLVEETETSQILKDTAQKLASKVQSLLLLNSIPDDNADATHEKVAELRDIQSKLVRRYGTLGVNALNDTVRGRASLKSSNRQIPLSIGSVRL